MTAARSRTADSNTIVIVESPAKARTIDGILGPDYTVASSVGHIRDLPQSAADIPEAVRGEEWARGFLDSLRFRERRRRLCPAVHRP